MKRKLKHRLWIAAIIDKKAFKVCFYTIDVETKYISDMKFSCEDVTGALVSDEFRHIFKKYNIENSPNIMFELFPFPRFGYELANIKIGHWYQFNDDEVRFLLISQNKAGYFYGMRYMYISNWFDGCKANDFSQIYNNLGDTLYCKTADRFYAIPFPYKEKLSILQVMT